MPPGNPICRIEMLGDGNAILTRADGGEQLVPSGEAPDILRPEVRPLQPRAEYPEAAETPGRSLQVVTDPEFAAPGLVLIGLSFHGDYQNIVLTAETARAFADAVLDAAATAA